MLRLSGRVAFITGGGTGIGRACALAFAREGAQVAVAGRRKEPLDTVAAEIAAATATGGGRALALSCDVTQRLSVEDALAQAEKHFGRLDTIVNNAGAVVVATVEHTSDADWDRVLAANLTGTFFVSRAALVPLRRAGGILRGQGGSLRLDARHGLGPRARENSRELHLSDAGRDRTGHAINSTDAECSSRNPKTHRRNSHRAPRQAG